MTLENKITPEVLTANQRWEKQQAEQLEKTKLARQNQLEEIERLRLEYDKEFKMFNAIADVVRTEINSSYHRPYEMRKVKERLQAFQKENKIDNLDLMIMLWMACQKENIFPL